MKKSILVFGLILGMNSLFAQTTTSIGPMIGFNSSVYKGDISTEKWKSPDLNVGLFLNHSKNDFFGIRLEALYSSMGTAFNNSPEIIKAGYIQVPVYGVAYLGKKGSAVRPKLMAGPYIGFLTNVGGTKVNLNKDDYNKVDFGLKGAAGANIRLSREIWLNADLYYGLGLADMYKSKTDVYNHSWGINAGVSFPVK
ncbi:porin family protein [Leadbetterella sp. DM7]|uniref:porin family protein n=1 Tax=Leadbetterella sp. DM7 TaxID=3235085 RepID=UPI00349E8BA5